MHSLQRIQSHHFAFLFPYIQGFTYQANCYVYIGVNYLHSEIIREVSLKDSANISWFYGIRLSLNTRKNQILNESNYWQREDKQ
jgi:hypothetical protein